MFFVYLKRYSLLKLILLSTTISFAIPGRVQAQSAKDSAAKTIQHLSSLYQRKVLTEKQYLDTIHGTMQMYQSEGLIFDNRELLKLLAVYREVIWSNKRNQNFRQAYYAILGNQAIKAGRNGEMMYYAEKLSELERQDNSPGSVTSLTLIANYYNSRRAFAKTLALFNKHRDFISGIPRKVLTQQLERRELMRSGDMLAYFEDAAYQVGDSLRAYEINNITRQLMDNVHKAYPSDKEIFARLEYDMLLSRYEKNISLGLRDKVWEDIQQLDELFKDPDTPEYLKKYIGFTVADKKAIFFLENRENDSAGHYINLLCTTYKDKLASFDAYIVKKYQARLLYNKGRFLESEDTLIKALDIIEAVNANTMTEIDEVMYALTKVEEQQYLLADSAKKQKRSDRQMMILGIGSVLLLSGSGFAFGIIKRRQKMRFVDFKLNLARNIHDETNPALLYARMLAKKQRLDYAPESGGELEDHIGLTMEHIRSLSQDLKSEQQLAIGDLLQDTRTILDKMSALSGFSYSIKAPLNRKRFLSHYQYHNLKAILQECITNSIKHAEFGHIAITFTIDINRLKISYSDNGKGWPGGQQMGGIGLQNMRDRIKKLNGDFVISNHYPDGYRIDMSIKLS